VSTNLVRVVWYVLKSHGGMLNLRVAEVSWFVP
jgi:hypothetical protein